MKMNARTVLSTMAAAAMALAVALAASGGDADVATDGLVAWWRMDEGKGPIVAYSVDPTGTNDGSFASFASTPKWTRVVPGPASASALDFDGDDCVSCGSGLDLAAQGKSAITIEAWVRPSRVNVDQVIFARVAADLKVWSYTMHVSPAGKFGALFNRDDGWCDGATSLLAGTWYHVAATCDAGKITLYVNGVADGSQTQREMQSGPGALTIGSLGTAIAPFTGIIDDLRIYNRALTPNEIRRNYEAMATGAALPV